MATPATAAPVQAPTVDAYIAHCSVLAQKMGITTVVIVAQDPGTKGIRVAATKGAMDAVRGPVADKFGLSDGGETEWS
jgi:hypothetical protein